MYKEFLFQLNNCSLEKERKIAVAVSGGIDSLALTLIAKDWATKRNIQIIGITVDHRLRKKSTEEAIYVSNLLKSKNIEHHILTLQENIPQKNIEAILRERRYKILTEFCKKKNIRVLLVGHHLQDQAETFFLRLFRGSGIDGLASMQNRSEINEITILRPFLNLDKENLRQYLVENKIQWVEDESNTDEKYLRNKIRNFLNTFEDKKIILKRINSAIEEIAKAKTIIDKEVAAANTNIFSFNPKGFYKINKPEFLNLEEDLGLRILANVLMKVSGNPYKPRLIKLKRIYQKILKGLKKETFYGCVLQKVDNNNFCVYREYSAIDADIDIIPGKEILWDNRFKITPDKTAKDFKVSHLKKGEFNQLLKEVKKQDYKKYKELKNLKGLEKQVFYTLPLLRKNGKIRLNIKKPRK
jgi:tRNA(Ile)-lysidine synthase